MDERTNLKYHINKFKNSITHLLRIKIKIKDEDKIIILLTALPKSHETGGYTFNKKDNNRL